MLLTVSLVGMLLGAQARAVAAAESAPIVTAHSIDKTLAEQSADEPHRASRNARPAAAIAFRQSGFHRDAQATARSEARAVTREPEPGRADRGKGSALRNASGPAAHRDLSARTRTGFHATPIRDAGAGAHVHDSTPVQQVNRPAVGTVSAGHRVTSGAIMTAGGVVGHRQRPPPLATLGGAAAPRAAGTAALSGSMAHSRF